MRRIGVVVNPVAGMGGRVGLKGTDGKVAAALEKGATPRAQDRAVAALAALAEYADEVTVLAAGGSMGAEAARAAGFDPTVVFEPSVTAVTTAAWPSAADTRAAVRAFVEQDVDLVLFVGGDGTAADVAETLGEYETPPPMLGVPAGVKVYSEVFAVRPRAAGHVAATFERTEAAEVNDIDEDDYREGEVHTELRAVTQVPIAEERQSSKQLGGGSVASLAAAVATDVRDGVTYVLGPGSSVAAVKEALGFEGTALGVDVWRDGAVLARDAAEADILDSLGDENVVIVSPIGGQGFLFGRGNQQLAPDIIRESAVEIVASRRKLDDIGVLRVDTGDTALDESLRGWVKVRVGRVERRLVEIV
jgi:NAD+ kinase